MNSEDDDDDNDVLVGSDKIVGEMAKRTITFNMMRRMVTLCESHPYVCSMNAKSELRTILWGVLVGSEVFAKVEHMQSAVAEYRTKCEQMGMKLINGSNSNPKDVRLALARTAREWCYMKHTLMWRLMSKHTDLEGINWESPDLENEVADKFYAIRPDCPEGKGCNRCNGEACGVEPCRFCGGEYLWLSQLKKDEGIDFTPCLEYSKLKPETELDTPIDKGTPGYQKLLVQFEAIKQIGLSAVNFVDGQASCRRKDIDLALLAIQRSVMHKPGSDYKLPTDGPTKFDYQVKERTYSFDGFNLELGDGQASAPHSAAMVVPSRLLIRGNIRSGAGAKDLKDSSVINMPIADLVDAHPGFLEEVNEASTNLSGAGVKVKPSELIDKLAPKFTDAVARRLVHEHLPSIKKAGTNATGAVKASAAVKPFEAIGANPKPLSAGKAAKALKALEPWCRTTKFSPTLADFESGYMFAHPAFHCIGPNPVWVNWGDGNRSRIPVRASMGGANEIIHKMKEVGDEEEEEEEEDEDEDEDEEEDEDEDHDERTPNKSDEDDERTSNKSDDYQQEQKQDAWMQTMHAGEKSMSETPTESYSDSYKKQVLEEAATTSRLLDQMIATSSPSKKRKEDKKGSEGGKQGKVSAFEIADPAEWLLGQMVGASSPSKKRKKK